MEEGAAHWLFMRTPHAYTSGDSLLRCCKAHGGISRSDDHAHLPRDNNRASALLPCATIHAQSAPAPQNGAPHERHAASGSDAAVRPALQPSPRFVEADRTDRKSTRLNSSH